MTHSYSSQEAFTRAFTKVYGIRKRRIRYAPATGLRGENGRCDVSVCILFHAANGKLAQVYRGEFHANSRVGTGAHRYGINMPGKVHIFEKFLLDKRFVLSYNIFAE